MDSPFVCATIILYNPDEKIINNIASYAEGIEKLYVIDNSENINRPLIETLATTFRAVEYVANNQNLGIATALNIACDLALKDGFKWILTMDQDSCFVNFTDYRKCLTLHGDIDSVALLAPNPQWHAKELLPENPSFFPREKNLVITSGNFLNLTMFNTIGRFEDKLFIDMVGHDYCLKAVEKGYKIFYFQDIMLQHSLGNLFQRKNLITKKLRNKIEHSPQRAYYITRNHLYLWKRHGARFPEECNLLRTLNILFIHEITKALLYEDQKRAKIKAKFLGLWHFLIGKYGKHEI
jgi:rhamnosyltransferase